MMAETHFQLAKNFRQIGDLSDAEDHLRRALEIHTEVFGEEDCSEIREVIEEYQILIDLFHQ